MKHLRSIKKIFQRDYYKQQKRKLRQYVFSMSYQDFLLAETISTVKVPMIVTYFEDGVECQDIVDWVAQGEVILDSRGRGSLQT